jgi:hypothetical protein
MNGRGEDAVSDTLIYFEIYPIFAEIKVRLRTVGPPISEKKDSPQRCFDVTKTQKSGRDKSWREGG